MAIKRTDYVPISLNHFYRHTRGMTHEQIGQYILCWIEFVETNGKYSESMANAINLLIKEREINTDWQAHLDIINNIKTSKSISGKKGADARWQNNIKNPINSECYKKEYQNNSERIKNDGENMPNINININKNKNKENIDIQNIPKIDNFELKPVEKTKSIKPTKNKHGEFKNVLLTLDELDKLKNKFQEQTEYWIKTLDEGIEQKGYKYKSHYLTILKWSEKDFNQPKNNKFKKQEYDSSAMDNLLEGIDD